MNSRTRKTILLVDDDAAVRASVAMCLSRAKFNVIEADCGKAAIRAYERRHDEIDLVLTDMVMPDLFGDQVAMHLWKRKPLLPIIFISGNPSEALEPGIALEPGVNFLRKPFVLDELLEIVSKQFTTVGR